MAPELLTATKGTYPASFASDVYALGITIVRIIKKGDHPFGLHTTLSQMACMAKGLVPPELQGLSWDLIDLIVKLIDKYPEKRPEMTLVLRHPYFVLTNDRTKRYFVDKLCSDFELLSKDDQTKQLKKIFNQHNFQEWYSTTQSGYLDTDDEIEEMSKNLSLIRKASINKWKIVKELVVKKSSLIIICYSVTPTFKLILFIQPKNTQKKSRKLSHPITTLILKVKSTRFLR
jgi:serine/threonine protein kinase